MASNPLTKISRQQETTWTALHKRISGISYDYSNLFDEDVRRFVENKAISLCSSIGYFAPSLLTSTAFILANNGATIDCGTHHQLPNLFTMFVGYPGTGKSAAIDHSATTPILSLLNSDGEQNDMLIGCATSSALVKQLSNIGKAYVVSSEIYDVLHKLLKSDAETASGDVQLLCKLFSGERMTYHFSTEQTREIEANTPFSILGATQMHNAAQLVARMDQGHGLMDRLLISIPLALRPTPQQQTDAKNFIETEPIDSFEEIFALIEDIHKQIPHQYKFHADAILLLQQMNTLFTAEVNAAILDGVMPPKSKKSNLVPRIALALHVFTHASSALLSGRRLHQFPTTIMKETFQSAVTFVEHLELQKDALCKFIQSITKDSCDQVRKQLTQHQIKSSALFFPGPVVSYRAFKQSASPKFVRTVTQTEYDDALNQLTPNYGTMISARVARAQRPTRVFVKKLPTQYEAWPSNSMITQGKTSTKKSTVVNVTVR